MVKHRAVRPRSDVQSVVQALEEEFSALEERYTALVLEAARRNASASADETENGTGGGNGNGANGEIDDMLHHLVEAMRAKGAQLRRLRAADAGIEAAVERSPLRDPGAVRAKTEAVRAFERLKTATGVAKLDRRPDAGGVGDGVVEGTRARTALATHTYATTTVAHRRDVAEFDGIALGKRRY
jgi:hypothetical protein